MEVKRQHGRCIITGRCPFRNTGWLVDLSPKFATLCVEIPHEDTYETAFTLCIHDLLGLLEQVELIGVQSRTFSHSYLDRSLTFTAEGISGKVEFDTEKASGTIDWNAPSTPKDECKSIIWEEIDIHLPLAELHQHILEFVGIRAASQPCGRPAKGGTNINVSDEKLQRRITYMNTVIVAGKHSARAMVYNDNRRTLCTAAFSIKTTRLTNAIDEALRNGSAVVQIHDDADTNTLQISEEGLTVRIVADAPDEATVVEHIAINPAQLKSLISEHIILSDAGCAEERDFEVRHIPTKPLSIQAKELLDKALNAAASPQAVQVNDSGLTYYPDMMVEAEIVTRMAGFVSDDKDLRDTISEKLSCRPDTLTAVLYGAARRLEQQATTNTQGV